MDLFDPMLYVGVVGSRRRDTERDLAMVSAAFECVVAQRIVTVTLDASLARLTMHTAPPPVLVSVNGGTPAPLRIGGDVNSALLRLGHRFLGGVTIVSGGCPKGGDRFARILAERWQVPLVEHLPDKTAFLDLEEPWRSIKQNYARNTLVARDSRDALVACVAPDRTGGTEDTIKKWKRFYPKLEVTLC